MKGENFHRWKICVKCILPLSSFVLFFIFGFLLFAAAANFSVKKADCMGHLYFGSSIAISFIFLITQSDLERVLPRPRSFLPHGLLWLFYVQLILQFVRKKSKQIHYFRFFIYYFVAKF